MNGEKAASGIHLVLIDRLIRENSNEEHPIPLNALFQKYADSYKGQELDEQSIRRGFFRNLESLTKFDDKIHIIKDDDTDISQDWTDEKKHIKEIYYEQEFNTTDLQIMSDAVVFSKHLNPESRRKLLKKMQTLYPQYHESNTFGLADWSDQLIEVSDSFTPGNVSDIYQNLQDLNEVIREKQCIRFNVCFYNSHRKLEEGLTVTGFSPYKICIQDGIYYLLGSLKVSERRQARNEENQFVQSIKRYPIHRITKIHPDPTNNFYAADKTQLKDKSIRELMESAYSAGDFMAFRQAIPHSVELFANDYGLQLIFDNFPIKDRKIIVTECSPASCNYPLYVTKTVKSKNSDDRIFYIHIKDLNKTQWYHLISLLIQEPSKHLVLLPTPELREIIKHLSEYLSIIDERYP